MKITRIAWHVALVAAMLLCVRLLPSAAPSQARDTSLIEKGKVSYQYWCATCHGPQMPGTVALATKYKDGSRPALLEERTDLTPKLLQFVVRNGASIMPFFRKTEVSDENLEAIVAYLTRMRTK